MTKGDRENVLLLQRESCGPDLGQALMETKILYFLFEKA